MTLDAISPVFNEKNQFFSEASLQENTCLNLCKKTKKVPTVECPDTSFSNKIFQTCERQMKIKS